MRRLARSNVGALSIVVFLCGTLAVTMAGDGESPPARAFASDDVLNVSGEVSLEDLLAVPQPLRRTAFNALSATTKASVVREQFRRQLGSGKYNSRQLGLIREAMAEVTPQKFLTARTPEDMLKCQDFYARAAEAFEPEELRMFFHFGDASPRGSSLELLSFSGTKFESILGGAVTQNWDCSCNSGSICDCTSVETCEAGAQNCTQLESGCGCFFIWTCDGLCCDYEYPFICWP